MAMKLHELIQTIEEKYPLGLAADWDPAGLQIEPATDMEVSKILLTLDLTHAVAEEAVENGFNLIMTYHPLLFEIPGRFIQSDPKAQTIMHCIRHGIAVYSPHTVLDAAPGGVTDWLAGGLGNGQVDVIEPIPEYPGTGHGRLVTLDQPASADILAQRVKEALDIAWVRIAHPSTGEHDIQTVAVCPGAGHSVIEHTPADALLTGEMRHHDILAANEKGQTVILCEHAASERGFLPVYADALRKLAPGVTVDTSQTDFGPLSQTL